MITAIIGPPGIGKTYWIQKQIAKAKGNLRYFSPQTESNPIDATLIQSEFPNIQILSSEQELNNFDEKETITYMEIPWYLNLLKIEPLLQQLNCHRVAIMPPRSQNTGWHAWADEIIMGNSLEEEQLAEISPNNPLEIHRGILTGEILDFKSLEVFWSELIEDAYGNIARVKGIFEIMDGQSIYGEFLHNLPQKDFEPLNLPRWYKGKPQRFSGFEIMGQNLDKEQIAQTVKQCCLPEQAINYYQQQIQSSLPKEELLL